MEAGLIPSFDLKRNYARIEGEIMDAVERVLSSQCFIMGPEVSEFEREAALYLETPRTVACASGTDALSLALMALDLGPGDEVVTTPFSFFATAGCIARLGARPVFADVEPGTYNVSMERVLDVLTPRTKAVIPVHLFGQLCGLEEITPELTRRGIPIIEDCAQSFGAHRMHEGRIMRSGSWGRFGCFSFFPTKNLGAYGDAGMICCKELGDSERISRLRVHGAAETYIHGELGINSRLDAIQAAILRVRLRHVETWIEERREAARRYDLMFAERGIQDVVTPPVEDAGNRHTYHQYVIRAKDRDALQSSLSNRGIVTRVYYPMALHVQPCMKFAGYKMGDMPVTERLTEEVLALPMFPEILPEEQERVVSAISDFYRG
ncbi:MAG: DegT/DnrJ/EryC1/StrS family aminotransferase [Synergistaceae bacterium]|jgi:dTDP-4-amino-4,6-dideoxygalactose transaminase|nr:DegT/DnrJ/EryC1/StrS family aminotransferase [Synergistaceae bacterium]